MGALVVVLVVLSVGLAAGTALVYIGLWRGIADQWKRLPPGNRQRGLIAGALAFVATAGATAVGIAEPWGPDSILYVTGIGGGAVMLVSLGGVAIQARRDMRRARERRSQQPPATRRPRPDASR